MADVLPSFEVEDNVGSTVAFNGTATTTPVNIPAVAGARISGFLIKSIDKNLEVSFDNGATFYSFDKRDVLTWDLKGDVRQLIFQTSSGSANFKGLLNLEEN